MDSLNTNNPDFVEIKNWAADIPCDILELILKKLHFTAQVRFGAVCKSWRGVSKNSSSTSCTYRLPWLLNHSWFYPFECKLFDPYSQKSYTVSNPIFHKDPSFGTPRVYASKNGWLLLGRDWLWVDKDYRSSLFFYNPFSNDVILLPELDFDFIKATFTTNPTCPECQVLVVVCDDNKNNNNSIVHNIYSICLSKDRVWSRGMGTPHISQEKVLLMSVHYMKGKLYCLFDGGLLKSYSLANKSWELLTPSLPAGNLDLCWTLTRCWLIEIGENLMTPFRSFKPDNEYKWSVFKFDWSRMSWILETSLKNIALFISGDISYSAPLIDDVHGGENLEEDCRVFYFDDDSSHISEECSQIYSEEYNWIKKTHRAMTFIEPPYIT